MIVTKHLLVHGQVQGVGYRMALTREAEAREVTGWVRNRSDGCVEAVIQGREDDVQSLLDWCWRGPRNARVERIDVGEGEGVFPDFALLATK